MTHTLKELLMEYAENNTKETMIELANTISNFIEDMRTKHEIEVEALMNDIKTTVVPYLFEDEAREALKKLVNEDGTTGPHWSKSQTDDVARKYGIDLTTHKFNDWDFYTAMNLTYSDMYNRDFQTEHYVSISKSFWLCDKDWCKDGKWLPGKLKWYVSSKCEYLKS